MRRALPKGFSWTVRSLDHLPEDGRRYELIDGVLYVTTWTGPERSDLDTRAISALAAVLHRYTFPAGLDMFAGGKAVRSASGIELMPDLIVVPTVERAGIYAIFEPMDTLLLAVDVKSGDGLAINREVTRQGLREGGMGEYWIVDVDARSVEVWSKRSTLTRIEADVLRWKPRDGQPELQVDLAAMFRFIESGRL